jgi:mono/diheme cytochrome c family protein
MLAVPALLWAGCGGEIDQLGKRRPSPPRPGTTEPAPTTPPVPGTGTGVTPTPTPTPTPGTGTGVAPPSIDYPPPPPPVPPPPGDPTPVTPTMPPTGMMPPVMMPPSAMPPTGPIGNPLPPPRVTVSEIEMPAGVHSILSGKCGGCHTYGERDPIGWGSVLDLSRMISSDIIVPGDPDKSRMWNRVAVRADMPYNGQRLTGPEIQVIRAWMGNLNRPAQKPRTHEQLLDLIVADQAKVRAQGNDHRYISFAHFVDERRSPEEMLAAEQVLGVVINSLSRRAQIVKLEPADPGRSIFRFRLSQLGWDRDDWDRLMEFYPYCLRSDRAAVRAVYDRLGTESPMIRGDWFLATATKPPLYHELLDLPDTLAQLEDDLNIDIRDNINRQPRPTAQRIGFQSSGVSQFNRMIERHRLGNNGGFFWISYDFNNDEDEANLRDNPLGPAAFDDQNFNRRFEHAGGEVIYSLPNGMQGYLLLAANGQRLDEAPKEIVKDPRRRAGAVTNGVSCFGCHGVTGMNRPRVYDEIVKYAEEHRNRFQARELTAIRELYPTNGAQILDADAARYLTAFQAAGGARPDPGVIEWDAFINLVGQYEAKVGLRGGAMELGLDPPAAAQLVQRGRAEDNLPTALSDPLVTRDDFVCRMRRIVPTIGTRPQFCRGTFTEDLVRNVCD